MSATRRPRVAAIGLSESELASIESLCGNLRPAYSIRSYLDNYSWTETDIVISQGLHQDEIDSGVHMFTLGPTSFGFWERLSHQPQPQFRELARIDNRNTERELTVSANCPPVYSTLAEQLSTELGHGEEAPPTATIRPEENWLREAIVVTSSNQFVALRLLLVDTTWASRPITSRTDTIGLFLPGISNLSEWFRAFLTDLHEVDPVSVPQTPPRLSSPSDWYAPEERALAAKIEETELEVARLSDNLKQLGKQLESEGQKADEEARRAIREDGEQLVAAVSEILSDLGFEIRDMDAGLRPNEQKHEDLRLTLPNRIDWEAIVEVKGYTNGTRTNDSRQIREHREHYIAEKGRPPDLTMWLVNHFRHMDPSSRPSPNSNAGDAAANVGAVHVLATDLYRLWVLAQIGELEAGNIVEELIQATPGLWKPRALGG